MHLLSGKTINTDSGRSILGQADNVTFSIIFYSEKTEEICKLETTIAFKNIDNEGHPVYRLVSEKLWSKKATGTTARKNLLDFDDNRLLLDRNDPNKKEIF